MPSLLHWWCKASREYNAVSQCLKRQRMWSWSITLEFNFPEWAGLVIVILSCKAACYATIFAFPLGVRSSWSSVTLRTRGMQIHANPFTHCKVCATMHFVPMNQPLNCTNKYSGIFKTNGVEPELSSAWLMMLSTRLSWVESKNHILLSLGYTTFFHLIFLAKADLGNFTCSNFISNIVCFRDFWSGVWDRCIMTACAMSALWSPLV